MEPNKTVGHITVMMASGRADKIELCSRDTAENVMNRAARQMTGGGAPPGSRLLHEGFLLDPLAKITEFDEEKVLTLVLAESVSQEQKRQ